MINRRGMDEKTFVTCLILVFIFCVIAICDKGVIGQETSILDTLVSCDSAYYYIPIKYACPNGCEDALFTMITEYRHTYKDGRSIAILHSQYTLFKHPTIIDKYGNIQYDKSPITEKRSYMCSICKKMFSEQQLIKKADFINKYITDSLRVQDAR